MHEDIKHIVDEMRRFRVDFYDSHNSGSKSVGAKTALSRRWVVFYQSLINLGIFSLNAGKEANGQPPEMQRLVLASHLANAQSQNAETGAEEQEDEDLGALDNLSANSDPTPIVEVMPEEINEAEADLGSKDKQTQAVEGEIREEDIKCADEPISSSITEDAKFKAPNIEKLFNDDYELLLKHFKDNKKQLGDLAQ